MAVAHDAIDRMSKNELERIVNAGQLELGRKDAAKDFLKFCQFMRPAYDAQEDATRSAFQVTPLAILVAKVVTKMEKGELLRACLSAPPQHGKSELISRLFVAWFMGRNPRKHGFVASYNQDMANEFGTDVRAIVRSARYRLVFPNLQLAKGSAAKDLLKTTEGGKYSFVGVGGSGSGKPADIMVIDDAIKGDEDSLTPTALTKLWSWFTHIVVARMRKRTAVVILNTRWSQDDLIGRLTDPTHPEFMPEVAAAWKTINIPAVVTDPTLADELGLELKVPTDPTIIAQFGSKPMAALWEDQHDLLSLAMKRQMDSRTFEALYMGRPSPEEGDYFKAAWIREYELKDLPTNLRKYGASDHAVSMKQYRDKTVLGCVGIDEHNNIWVLPDVVWAKMETDTAVENLIQKMIAHKPMLWWMESELIAKSFGPFLRSEMIKRKVYTVIDPQNPSKDKKTRARAIQGRMAMGVVYFPKFAPWWPDARHQMLTFPHAAHDDFVDWLSWIGMGLTKEITPMREAAKAPDEPKYGTIAWIKHQSEARKQADKRRKAMGGI